MIGIGGSGMSGIAEVLATLGYAVRGSDLAESAAVQRLRQLGITVFLGHARGQVGDAQVVVRSSAVRDDNPEILEARERGIPIIPRAEMLAELMRLKIGVAVGGTHGKTTTTSLIATVFTEAGLDPTVIIGGRLNALGSNARLGAGEYLVAEADESDGSFLCLLPQVAVITNVDADHLDFYPDLAAIETAFVQFANNVPFYGLVVACGDDPGVQAILPRIKRPVQTYGFGSGNHWRAEVLEVDHGSRFRVWEAGSLWGEAVVAQPGRHNVLNALAVIAVAQEAGISPEAICHGLAHFAGVGRRFERKGERGGVLVVDDYGHHPTEIAATLATARQVYPDRRLVVAFQPHRFTRTKALFGEFARVFSGVDTLLLTEIYAASEDPIPGVSGQSLAQAIRQVSDTPVYFFADFAALEAALPQYLRPGDVLLTLGAGSIWTVGQRYLEG
jgi:UDP-N-acetylmuramate--alanine ligase